MLKPNPVPCFLMPEAACKQKKPKTNSDGSDYAAEVTMNMLIMVNCTNSFIAQKMTT